MCRAFITNLETLCFSLLPLPFIKELKMTDSIPNPNSEDRTRTRTRTLRPNPNSGDRTRTFGFVACLVSTNTMVQPLVHLIDQIWVFFSGISLFPSMSGESIELILNQHSILHRMMSNSCIGHTPLVSTNTMVQPLVHLIDQIWVFFSGISLLPSMSGESIELILNQHSILDRMM